LSLIFRLDVEPTVSHLPHAAYPEILQRPTRISLATLARRSGSFRMTICSTFDFCTDSELPEPRNRGAIARRSPAEPARDRSPRFQPGVSWSPKLRARFSGRQSRQERTSRRNAPPNLSPAKAGLQPGATRNPRLKPGAAISSRLRRQNVQTPEPRNRGAIARRRACPERSRRDGRRTPSAKPGEGGGASTATALSGLQGGGPSPSSAPSGASAVQDDR